MGIMREIAMLFLLTVLVAGCQTTAGDRQQEIRNTKPAPTQVTPAPTANAPTVAPSPTRSPTTSATPAPTFTPTPTPTPTATAVPVSVIGDPRKAVEDTLGMNMAIVCGLVDFFDFPLEPPHAGDNVRGGGDFGRYRGRYEKYHAGEDWWVNGRGSLGAPVYSIGHGQVTYAEPTGWGRDQGVIIVRHTYMNGREVLSFYGHLDPESFEVRAGDCVTRGQMLAKIGKPRSSPHLHFEMRTHMPLETGTGYWPEDPTGVGWVPPSATIWQSRLSVSPGAIWTQFFAGNGIEGVGLMGEDLFIGREGSALVGIDLADGRRRWRKEVADNVERVLLDQKERLIYAANQFGEVTALTLLDEENAEPTPLWVVDLDVTGIPELLPLPGGGVVLSARGEYAALSAAGEIFWELDAGVRPFDWVISGDRLIISSTSNGGSLWSADARGWNQWDAALGGRLSASDDHVWLYDGQSIYRMDADARSAEKVLDLSLGNLQRGDILALPDGSAILAHADAADQRLIMVDENGTMRWERSMGDHQLGAVELFADQGQQFLLARKEASSGSEVSILAIDDDGVRLTNLFHGGTRDDAADRSHLVGFGSGRVLINIDGRSLTAIDLQAADLLVSAYPANGQ